MFLEIGTLAVAILLVVISAVYLFYDPMSPKPHGILAIAAIFLFVNKLLLGMPLVSLIDVGLFIWNAHIFLKRR